MTPRFSAQPRPSDFFRAFFLPAKALLLILRTPVLRRSMAMCAALTLACFVVVFTGLVFGIGPLLRLAWPFPEEGGFSALIWYVTEALAFVILAALGVTTLPVLVLTPLQEQLCAGTETALDEEDAKVLGAQTVAAPPVATRGVFGSTVVRVLVLWMGNLGFLVLAGISGPLGVLAGILGLGWTALWMAVEYLDIPLSRHGRASPTLFSLVRARFFACLGFGAAVFLLMWVPVVNLFFIPVAVVAGTLLFRGLNAFPPLAPDRYGVGSSTDETSR